MRLDVETDNEDLGLLERYSNSAPKRLDSIRGRTDILSPTLS
jgi:hypothetical protein